MPGVHFLVRFLAHVWHHSILSLVLRTLQFDWNLKTGAKWQLCWNMFEHLQYSVTLFCWVWGCFGLLWLQPVVSWAEDIAWRTGDIVCGPTWGYPEPRTRISVGTARASMRKKKCEKIERIAASILEGSYSTHFNFLWSLMSDEIQGF